MSSRNQLFLSVLLISLGVLTGCGGSSSGTAITPPPAGSFSNSTLSGTYVFSFSGEDLAKNTFFSMVGTIDANGSGGITGGTIDVIDPGLTPTVSQGVAVQNNSEYTITPDGRGHGAFVTSQFGTIGIDFVLSSSSHGTIIRFDSNGAGSGTIDLQDSTLTQADLTAYAFSLSGQRPTNTGSLALFFTVGNFALNGGTTLTGLQDFNDDNDSTNLTSLALSGSLNLGSAASAGTATLTAAGVHYGALTFDVWPIDSTHLKLIETDGNFWMEGDAFTQQATVSAGQLVYTASGIDSAGYLFAFGGFMTYNGSSGISNGYQDMNDGGNGAQASMVSGTMQTISGTGRYSLTLNGIYNGVDFGLNPLPGTYSFAAYPFVSGVNTGVFFLETDNLGATGGAAFRQTAQVFAARAGYGLNLTGAKGASQVGEVDAIAEFAAYSARTLSNGVIDENDGGNVGFARALGNDGTYSFDSPATGRGILTYPATQTPIGALNLSFYVIDGSTMLFIEEDSAQVALGSFQAQSTPGNAALEHAQQRLAMLRVVADQAGKRPRTAVLLTAGD